MKEHKNDKSNKSEDILPKSLYAFKDKILTFLVVILLTSAVSILPFVILYFVKSYYLTTTIYVTYVIIVINIICYFINGSGKNLRLRWLRTRRILFLSTIFGITVAIFLIYI